MKTFDDNLVLNVSLLASSTAALKTDRFLNISENCLNGQAFNQAETSSRMYVNILEKSASSFNKIQPESSRFNQSNSSGFNQSGALGITELNSSILNQSNGSVFNQSIPSGVIQSKSSRHNQTNSQSNSFLLNQSNASGVIQSNVRQTGWLWNHSHIDNDDSINQQNVICDKSQHSNGSFNHLWKSFSTVTTKEESNSNTMDRDKPFDVVDWDNDQPAITLPPSPHLKNGKTQSVDEIDFENCDGDSSDDYNLNLLADEVILAESQKESLPREKDGMKKKKRKSPVVIKDPERKKQIAFDLRKNIASEITKLNELIPYESCKVNRIPVLTTLNKAYEYVLELKEKTQQSVASILSTKRRNPNIKIDWPTDLKEMFPNLKFDYENPTSYTVIFPNAAKASTNYGRQKSTKEFEKQLAEKGLDLACSYLNRLIHLNTNTTNDQMLLNSIPQLLYKYQKYNPKKDKDILQKPRKTPNPFILYCKYNRKFFSKLYSELSNKEITRKLSDTWRGLGESDKDVWRCIGKIMRENETHCDQILTNLFQD